MADDTGRLLAPSYAAAVRPRPLQSVSDWADQNRLLSTKGATAAGPWKTAKTPYLREIMDCMSQDSPVQQVVFQKAAQLGATEALLNLVGYSIDHYPGPVMIVQPTIDMARDFSRQRLEPMLMDNPRIAALVGMASGGGVGRRGGRSALTKGFPGGILFIRGGNAPAGLRSNPIRVLCLDEVDSYPGSAGDEGDPVGLAIRRTATFEFNRKIMLVSTPLLEGTSRIARAFRQTDQRRYFLPCPDCGEFQVLDFKNVRWSDLGRPPLRAAYVCEHCGSIWENWQKEELLAKGAWRPTAKIDDPMLRGYHLSGLYSPWASWGSIAAEFLRAKDSDFELQQWTNTVKGETWSDRGEAPDWRRLYDRREDWEIGTIPEPVILLTAAVDVQDDRLEFLLRGWGREGQSWVIDWQRLPGDPGRKDVWIDLEALLRTQYEHPSGAYLSIERMAVDTGGHYTQSAYAFGRAHPERVMLIKGTRSPGGQITPPPNRLRSGEVLWSIGTHTAKQQVYAALKLHSPTEDDEDYPPRFVHIPKFPDEFFKQMTAERFVIVRNKKGFFERDFVQEYHRNEVLDLMVYTEAIAEAYRLFTWPDSKWDELGNRRGVLSLPKPREPKIEEQPPRPPQRQPRNASPRRGFGPPPGGFGVGRWA